MDQGEKHLLERTAALAEENNKILHKMQRSARIGKLMHFLYWVLIVVVGVAAYFFIQPYIEAAQDLYSEARGTVDSIRESAR